MPKVKTEWIVNRKEVETVISESEVNLRIENYADFILKKQEICSDDFPLPGLTNASWSIKIRDNKEKEQRLCFTVSVRGVPKKSGYKWKHSVFVNEVSIYSFTAPNTVQDRETYSWKHDLAFKNVKDDKLALTLKLQVTLSSNRPAIKIDRKNEKTKMLKTLSEDKDFTDFTFILGKKKIPVHKCILAAQSPMLSNMFKIKMVENQEGTCKVTHIDEPVFLALIKYAYDGATPDNFSSLAKKLYEVADYYQVASLKLLCEEELQRQLSPENALEIYFWTIQYSDLKDLKANAWIITKNVVLKDHITEDLLQGDMLKPSWLEKIKELRENEKKLIGELKKQ